MNVYNISGAFCSFPEVLCTAESILSKHYRTKKAGLTRLYHIALTINVPDRGYFHVHDRCRSHDHFRDHDHRYLSSDSGIFYRDCRG